MVTLSLLAALFSSYREIGGELLFGLIFFSFCTRLSQSDIAAVYGLTCLGCHYCFLSVISEDILYEIHFC